MGTQTIADEVFRVENNLIQNPGRFEGQPRYVPHFWNIFMDGGSDRDDGEVLGFDVDAEDRRKFPELKGRMEVNLIQMGDGFIYEVSS